MAGLTETEQKALEGISLSLLNAYHDALIAFGLNDYRTQEAWTAYVEQGSKIAEAVLAAKRSARK